MHSHPLLYRVINVHMYMFFQVMEKAELLRDTDANLLPALLRLQELVRKYRVLFVLSIK